MNDQDIIEKVSGLTPTQFENLVFDIVRAMGLKNVVWRTPGADGGRDIEGVLATSDPTGFAQMQKWHVECKRYASAIDWPTIWEKIAHADAVNADVLFLVTNSNPSPTSESRITAWNNDRKRPAIRVWRGYNFPTTLRTNIDIAVAHGIIEQDNEATQIGAAIALELAKLVHSAHGAIEFERGSRSAIEAASALAELLEHRLRDLKEWGQFIRGPSVTKCEDYSWLQIKEIGNPFEEVGFRALVSLLRHYMQCDHIIASENGDGWKFEIVNRKPTATENLQDKLSPIAHWLRCDNVTEEEPDGLRVKFRE